MRGLTRDDVVAFHRRHYGPDQALLAVVGDVEAAKVLPQIERRFGAWAKTGTPALPPVPPTPAGPDGHLVVVLDKPDAVQTEIRIGQAALPYRDPDHYAAQVYNSVVGGSSSARLFQEVRRKRGLAYGAYSSFDDASQPGLFEAVTSTKTESTVEALEVALGVLRDMQENAVPAPELEAAKSYITGAFPLEIETPDGIADKVLEAMKFGYGKEFLETYNEHVAAVSAADLQRFAKTRTAPGRAVLVLVGNAAVFGDALKAKLGDKITVLPYREVDFLQADLRKKAAEKVAVSEADATKARDLLAQARQAMGGKAFAEQRSQIVRGSGSMTPPGAPGAMPIKSVVVYEVYPDQNRTELDLPFGKMVQTVDGAVAWAGVGTQVQDLPADAADERFYGLDALRRFDAPGRTVRPLPDAEVDGKPAQVVEVADAEGHATRFYLDPTLHRVVKIAYESGGSATETRYSDYREVDGVQVAFRSDIIQNGTPLFTIELAEVKVNPAVDAALFKKPAP